MFIKDVNLINSTHKLSLILIGGMTMRTNCFYLVVFCDINPRSGRFKSADSNGWAPNGEVPRSSHFVVKTSDIETTPYGSAV